MRGGGPLCQPWLISHTVPELVAQRVYALALGYEDLSEHDQLREDPLLAVLNGKPRPGQEALAGKSTLNRLELGGEQPTRYKKIHYREAAIDELLTKVFLEAHTEAPEPIVLDLDTTDLALHGHQEGRFFHGYYDSYCYLPLYIFAGEHLLCAAADGGSGCRGRKQTGSGAGAGQDDPAARCGCRWPPAFRCNGYSGRSARTCGQ